MFSVFLGQPERDKPPNLFDFLSFGSSSEDPFELFLDLFGSGFDVRVVVFFSTASERQVLLLSQTGEEIRCETYFLPSQFL